MDGVLVGVGVGGANAVGVGNVEACDVKRGSFKPLVGLVHGHGPFSVVIADGLELGDEGLGAFRVMEGDWFEVVTRREGDAGGKAGDIPIGKGSGQVGDVVGEGEGEIWLGWILVREADCW
jgi:hypothetical protein